MKLPRLQRHDFDLALLWFLTAALLCGLFPGLYLFLALAAALLNLLHVRFTAFSCGEPFQRRVREVLISELAEFNKRLVATERGVDDVKDAQVKIAGTFRGRQMP